MHMLIHDHYPKDDIFGIPGPGPFLLRHLLLKCQSWELAWRSTRLFISLMTACLSGVLDVVRAARVESFTKASGNYKIEESTTLAEIEESVAKYDSLVEQQLGVT